MRYNNLITIYNIMTIIKAIYYPNQLYLDIRGALHCNLNIGICKYNNCVIYYP